MFKVVSVTGKLQEIPSSLRENFCTEEVIDKIPNFVGRKYIHFALEMGLSLADIEKIEEGPNRRKLFPMIKEIIGCAASKLKGHSLCSPCDVPVRLVAAALLVIRQDFNEFVNLVLKSGTEDDDDEWYSNI